MRLLLLPMLIAAAIATPARGWIPGPFIIFFDPGSDRLDDVDRAIMDNAVHAIALSSPGYVVIAGHTDRTGTPEQNLRLSCRRARAARDYLASRGVAPERMVTLGYGEQDPLTPNTDDGVAEGNNRSVRFQILPPGQDVYARPSDAC